MKPDPAMRIRKVEWLESASRRTLRLLKRQRTQRTKEVLKGAVSSLWARDSKAKIIIEENPTKAGYLQIINQDHISKGTFYKFRFLEKTL